MYRYNGTAYSKIGLDINGENNDDHFGSSVSLSRDGNTIAIGGPSHAGKPGTDSGHVRVLRYDGTKWNPFGNEIDGESSGDESGTSVSLSRNGRVLAIGAPNAGGAKASMSGHVRVYEYDSSDSDDGLSTGAIVGIVVGSVVGAMAIVVGLNVNFNNYGSF